MRVGAGEAGSEGRLTFSERTRLSLTTMLDPGACGLTVCSGRGYHEFTHSQNEVGFRQICVTISVFLCSKLLSFCQIFVTITTQAQFEGSRICNKW
jgi:hypothetical protein